VSNCMTECPNCKFRYILTGETELKKWHLWIVCGIAVLTNIIVFSLILSFLYGVQYASVHFLNMPSAAQYTPWGLLYAFVKETMFIFGLFFIVVISVVCMFLKMAGFKDIVESFIYMWISSYVLIEPIGQCAIFSLLIYGTLCLYEKIDNFLYDKFITFNSFLIPKVSNKVK
jgi:hypothetical protein